MDRFDTFLAQLGNKSEHETGAISAPIHLSTTYRHPGFGHSTGYDYTRTANPTRDILQEGLAYLEAGDQAIVTSSGMSAIQLAFQLFERGSTFLVSRDLYGGSYRYFDGLEEDQQAHFIYFQDQHDLEEKLDSSIDAIFLESPTNPLMQSFDIPLICQWAKKIDAKVIVDNTLLTPLRQRPLEDGADIVIHSGTKFLAGHNDLMAGVIVVKGRDLAEKLFYMSNTTGPTLGPFDCWLFIRSLKTLRLRFDRQEENAQQFIAYLNQEEAIKDVLYAGQGAMVSVRLADADSVHPFLENLQIFTYAESLGGVESLVTYPTTQTHADIPQELRESYGLTPDLIRFSIGIEKADDLIQDVKQALDKL